MISPHVRHRNFVWRFKAVSIAITTRWKVWQWMAFDNHIIFAVPTQAPSYLFGVCGFVGQGYVQMCRKESVRLYQSHTQTRRRRYVFLCDRKFHRGLGCYRFTILPWLLQLHRRSVYCICPLPECRCLGWNTFEVLFRKMSLLNFKLLNIEFAYIATHLRPSAPTYLIKSSLHVLERSAHQPILQFGIPHDKTAFVGVDVEFECIDEI